MNNKKKNKFLVQGAAIAAIYVVLTFFANVLGLSSGVIQLRLSEALCVLPIFTPAAVWGLFAGCVLANAMTGCMVIDIIFGSLATLIGALLTRWLCNRPILALIPPILSNTLIIPFVLKYTYGFEGTLWYFMATVGVGEVLSCGVLGWGLFKALEKRKRLF